LEFHLTYLEFCDFADMSDISQVSRSVDIFTFWPAISGINRVKTPIVPTLTFYLSIYGINPFHGLYIADLSQVPLSGRKVGMAEHNF
jgi:hypothetical protein